MTEISTHDLIDVIEEVLGRFLVASDSPRVREPDQSDVQRAALWFVQAELLKLPAFGIQMLLRDLGRLDAMHEAVPASTPAVSPLAIDAARFPGHVALACAVRLAAQAVRSQGAAIVGIRNVGALGVLGCAARSLAAEGAVAVVSANCMAFVAPWGGAAATGPIPGTVRSRAGSKRRVGSAARSAESPSPLEGEGWDGGLGAKRLGHTGGCGMRLRRSPPP